MMRFVRPAAIATISLILMTGMLLPPNARFEATLEDISPADAPANLRLPTTFRGTLTPTNLAMTFGGELRLSAGPTTLMACPPPLDMLERSLISTLEGTRSYRITAQTLELFDAEGTTLALMEAVYFR